MNTAVQTQLYTDQLNAQAILQDIRSLFASFEKRLSRFEPDSELSRLNVAEQETFPASPILLDAVEIALWAAEVTGGLYDPTILNNLEAAGYDRSFEQVANVAPLDRSSLLKAEQPDRPIRRVFTFRSIQLNRVRREIYKPVGLRLDLGGMGKGWTVDRAADRLQGLGPFIINAGGDIFAYHSPPGQKGWQIDIIHPLQPERFTARLYLHHRALATSTMARRRWRHNNRIMHHLIDPRTGQPAQTDALSVSVIADRTVIAEILAKVVLILGAEMGLSYLQTMPGVEGLIYTANAEIVYTQGMAEILDRLEPAGFTI
jgi:thiamine biosynthesis lipoprotein